MHRQNLTFESFAQENGQENFKHAHKVGKNRQKVYTNNKKNTSVPACTFKSRNVAQSHLNFALPHNGETVTFRNSVSYNIRRFSRGLIAVCLM